MNDWKYWYIRRNTQKFIPWVARKLPKRLKYFVVIDGVSQVFAKTGVIGPDTITGVDILKHWE